MAGYIFPILESGWDGHHRSLHNRDVILLIARGFVESVNWFCETGEYANV